MRTGKQKRLDFYEQTEGRKRVTTLMKSGNLKKISGKQLYSLNITRNRIITITLAIVVILVGLFSLFF